MLKSCNIHFLFLGISGSFRLLRSPFQGGVELPRDGGCLILFPFNDGGSLGCKLSPFISQSVSRSLLEDVGESSSTVTSCTNLLKQMYYLTFQQCLILDFYFHNVYITLYIFCKRTYCKD